ncbi:MAG: gluconate 2-dehydrogenase subunit 3 family protein [Bryobacteraceae bacterium]
MADKNLSEEREEDQTSPQVSRRQLFNVIGSVPVVAALSAGSTLAHSQENQQDHTHMAERQQSASKGPYQRKVFDDNQWHTVHVLSDHIVPADERSGSATQAGVPEFIDDWIYFRNQEDGNNRLEAQILGGLMWLDRESNRQFQKVFADAAPEQQKQILDRIAWPARASKDDQVWVLFFNIFRDLTVSGFYSSKVGVADLPYVGNTVVTDWQGCPPKVWAIIEDRMKNGFNEITKDTRTIKA